MGDDINKDLKNSSGDVLHTLAKVCIGSIPIVGGAGVELFGMILNSPIEKRKEEWLKKLYAKFEDLQNNVEDFQIDKLSENENFISIMMRAYQLAIIEHQEEKLLVLQNAVINSANNISINDSEQQMFINLINTFTVWHLRILNFIKNFLDIDNIKKQECFQVKDILINVYSELKGKDSFIEYVFDDLYRYHLIKMKDLATVIYTNNDNHIVSNGLTYLGINFMKYIE